MKHAVWDLKSQYAKQNIDEVFDCMIAEYLISYGKYLHSQESILKKYNVSTLDELAKKQQEILDQTPDLRSLFYTIEQPLIPVLWEMEQSGITLDTKRLEEIGIEIDHAIESVKNEIDTHIGMQINLNSPIQVGNYLAEKEGVPLKKTKTGKYATSEPELAQFSEQFKIIHNILSYRGLAKLRSTYVDTLIARVDKSGRVHTTYSQTAANTGRLASTNPNLQNIPVTSEFGQKIKSCFMASEGHTLLSFDYSQQELRILAHLTGEEKLIHAFNENQDVHKITASQLFNVAYKDVTKDQRTVGKTINFGIIYGMSSFGLSKSLSIPVDQAQIFIDTFYTTYPKIKTFYDSYFKKAKIDEYVTTILGRRRNVYEFPGKKFIDNSMHRVLLNYPIQGSAADLMKKAMIDVHNSIVAGNPAVQLLLQIHDDLVFEVKDVDIDMDQLVGDIRKTMCSVYPLSVPIEVDVKIGKRWGEMEPYIPKS